MIAGMRVWAGALGALALVVTVGGAAALSRGATGLIAHIALVSGVERDGRYRVIEASRDEWYLTREEDGGKMLGRGWVFRGFGRPLGRRR